MVRRNNQLELFGGADHPWPRELDALGAALPANLELGTSSWTFPGWSGLCYPRGTSMATLQERGLALYSKYPLFRTVGIDRSLYRPIPRDELAAYAEQLPPTFRVVAKVWDRIVTARFPRHARFGPLAGRDNPDFLNADLFGEAVVAPHHGTLDRHVGAFLLELPPLPADATIEPDAFVERLGRFLDLAPAGLPFAVELRNPELLTPAYLRLLSQRNIPHVYNFWARMPPIAEQLKLAPPTADVMIARLLLPPGTDYETRKAAFAPFDRLHEPNEPLRDDVTALARLAIESGRVLRVIVNNKAEGSAPLTVKALAERIRRRSDAT